MRRHLHTALAIAAALGLLALVLYLAGAARTLDAIERLTVWQAAALTGTAFGVTFFTSLAWQQILEHYGHHLSVWLLFRLTMLAFAIGWIIPSGFVAGIPAAAFILTRERVPFTRGLASFTIGRFFEITAYAVVLPLVLASGLGGRLSVRAAAILVLAGLLVVYLDLAFGWRLFRRALGRLRRVLPRVAQRSVDAAIEFCRVVADFFRAAPARIVLAAAYSVIAIGIAFVRALLAAEFLHIGLTIPQIAVMFSITIFLMAVPFLPGAIGAYEGGIAGAFELLGHSRASGMAYAIIVHATELLVVIAGVVVLGHIGLSLAQIERGVSAAQQTSQAHVPSGRTPPRSLAKSRRRGPRG